MAAVSTSMSLTYQQKAQQLPISEPFLKSLPLRPSRVVCFSSKPKAGFRVEASMKERAITGLAAANVAASMVIPEVAQAAGSDLTPSLKNFFLSLAVGGVMLAAILFAVVGVSNFDPVKRS